MLLIRDLEGDEYRLCVSYNSNPCPETAKIIITEHINKSFEVPLCKKCAIKLVRGIYKRFNFALAEFLKELLK